MYNCVICCTYVYVFFFYKKKNFFLPPLIYVVSTRFAWTKALGQNMSSLIFQEHSESEFLTYCCHTHYTCYTSHYRSQVSVSQDMLAVPRWLMPMSASLSLLSKSICHANLVTLHHSPLGDKDSLKVDVFSTSRRPSVCCLKLHSVFPAAGSRCMRHQTVPCHAKPYLAIQNIAIQYPTVHHANTIITISFLPALQQTKLHGAAAGGVGDLGGTKPYH